MSFPRPLLFVVLPAAVLMLRALPALANCETTPPMAGCPGASAAHSGHGNGQLPAADGVQTLTVPPAGPATGDAASTGAMTPEAVRARLEKEYEAFINAPPDKGAFGRMASQQGFRFSAEEIRERRKRMVDPQFNAMRAALTRDPQMAENVDEKWFKDLRSVLDLKRDIIVAQRMVEKRGNMSPELRQRMERLEKEYTDMKEGTPMGDLHIKSKLGMVYMEGDARFIEKLKAENQRDHNRDWQSRAPDSSAAHRFAGDTHMRLQDPAAARDAYGKAISLDPSDAAALAGRGAANLQLGDYRGAYGDASKALELDPNNKAAFATAKMSEGRGGGAGSGYSPQTAASAAHGRGFMGGGSGGGGSYSFGTAKRTPGAAAAARFNNQARSAFSMGDARATLDFAARALAADPDNARAYHLRAMAYRSMGDWKAALAAAAKGLELAPKDAGLMAVYGNALNRTKDYKGALAAANRALEVNPLDAWAFANRAYALGALGDREGMLENLRRAAALNPDFQPSLDQATQTPTDADLLFLFPGENATDKKGAMGTAGRKKSFGLLAGAAALGGLFLALGLLSTVLAPLTDKVSSVFTRMTRRSPSVTASPEAAVGVAVSGLLRGQFALGKQIGAGGMGLVYEGTDRSLNRRVAVKRMRDEIRLDPRERARFVSEAKTVAGLHHPNIVDIYAIVEESDDLHLVFEYVEGRTVHELLSAKGRFTPAEAARVVRGAADALDYAHGRGVIHRDMKPSNLMIDGSGRVKVMDFGIARVAKDAMTRISMTNTVVGTPPYMAPEQEQGQVRKESDVYALAICAYELLCGRLPFPGVGAGMLMNKINLSYVPPSKMIEGLPAGLDEVFAKAFQPDPDKRYHGSGEFAAALEAVLSSPVRA